MNATFKPIVVKFKTREGELLTLVLKSLNEAVRAAAADRNNREDLRQHLISLVAAIENMTALEKYGHLRKKEEALL